MKSVARLRAGKILHPVVVSLVAVPSATAQCSTTIFDGEFASWTWTFTTSGGGFANGAMSVSPSGGNSGACISATLSASSSAVIGEYAELVMTKTDAVWDPAVDGTISAVTFEIDHRVDSGCNLGHYVAPVVTQNGFAYVTQPVFSGNSMSWGTMTLGPFGPADFGPHSCTSCGFHPDSSAAGAPIQFGVFARIFTCPLFCPDVSCNKFYDNFRMTVSGGPSSSVTPLGPGCGASPPAISSTSPVIGSTITVGVSGAVPNTPGALFAGAPASPPLPLGSGCEVFLDPAILVIPFATLPGGGWSTMLAIPPDPALCGRSAAVQGVLLPTSGPLGFDLTEAILLTLGS